MGRSFKQFRKELDQIAKSMPFDDSGSDLAKAVVEDHIAELQQPGDVVYAHPNNLPPCSDVPSQPVTKSVSKVGYSRRYGDNYDAIFGKPSSN